MMQSRKRLRVAIQKKGRLSEDSARFLQRSGLEFCISNTSLIIQSKNFPVDILLMRDNDIPDMVMDGVCDLGIVGQNVLYERKLSRQVSGQQVNCELLMPLNFGLCRLSIAFPAVCPYQDSTSLRGLRIATSYPQLLNQFLKNNDTVAEILSISGSVEIAPALGMADAICDLVSTGNTLKAHNLREVSTVIESQAVLVRSKNPLPIAQERVVSQLTALM